MAYPNGFGYVLDFSDRTMEEFFEDEFGIENCFNLKSVWMSWCTYRRNLNSCVLNVPFSENNT